MKTLGEALIEMLEFFDVDTVFGIPGVHTVELYRGLASSSINHITPRHEQGAGFMADGYARTTGKPGVCFLITGPGLTNAITAMAQARQDSIPMLVISGVNPYNRTGRGDLHELPNQHGLLKQLTEQSYSIQNPFDLSEAISDAFDYFANSRGGPVHIEIPIDIMSMPAPDYVLRKPEKRQINLEASTTARFRKLILEAKTPIILAGGGMREASKELVEFAERIQAPVITTANGRSVIGNHSLHVSASASLPEIRSHIAEADLVLAIGTEFGPTDYDVFVDGQFPALDNLIRIDICEQQIAVGPPTKLSLVGDCQSILQQVLPELPQNTDRDAATVSARIMQDANTAVTGDFQQDLEVLDAIANVLPDSIIVGDSTQVIYSGNCLLRSHIPKGWFNAATGYGTLGYAAPAAIGAQLAAPDAPVVCLVGDGGLQFSLPELGTAVQNELPILFLVWNNFGYSEINKFMKINKIEPIGVRPIPPELIHIAEAYNMSYERVADLDQLTQALKCWSNQPTPLLLEFQAEPVR